jgi:hypothetical protein
MSNGRILVVEDDFGSENIAIRLLVDGQGGKVSHAILHILPCARTGCVAPTGIKR